MFVVRIDRFDESPDYKVFEKRQDAQQRFSAAAARVPDEFEGAVLFYVPTSDVRQAVEDVKAGAADILIRDTHHDIMKGIGKLIDDYFAEENSR